jgi:crotonobetainyl-CoA:carnitine CoA-transferase CaiB-like acyl-CoA transferase
VLELHDDPRFRTNPDRVRNRDALRQAIDGALAGRSLEEWEQLLVDAGVPAARVRTVTEAMADEHTAALGILQQLGAGVTVAPPLRIDGERPLYPSPPPAR